MGDFRYMGKSLSGVQRGLSSLTDANISNPQDGDTLVYNGTTGKWEADSTLNSKIDGNHYDIEYTATANMTYDGVLTWLKDNVDFTKVTGNSIFNIAEVIFKVSSISSTNLGISTFGTISNGTYFRSLLVNSAGTVKRAFTSTFTTASTTQTTTNDLNTAAIITGGKILIKY